ncbi:MAG: hypothetical protein JSS83_01795 [Cyanobacteria bacterium SZAS LIN-3]|nr:hypothetical protein [Cyanobacteria bacterium SZAS LIN-3]
MAPVSKPLEIARLGIVVGELVAPEAVVASERFVQESLAAMFAKPQKMIEVLPKLGRLLSAAGHEAGEDGLALFEQPLAKNHPLANLQVTRFLGSGESQFVMVTERNTALKLGPDAVLRPVANTQFEAPVLSHGKLTDSLHFYEQPLGVTSSVTDKHVAQVIGKIRSSGYVENDLWDFGRTRTDQVALFGPKRVPLLIDQGSAVPGYGTVYGESGLVAHPQQATNLASIREFLADRQIGLIPRSAVTPKNPLLGGEHTFSRAMSDGQLTDTLGDYLSMTSAQPTMARYWSRNEVEHALATIAQGGK